MTERTARTGPAPGRRVRTGRGRIVTHVRARLRSVPLARTDPRARRVDGRIILNSVGTTRQSNSVTAGHRRDVCQVRHVPVTVNTYEGPARRVKVSIVSRAQRIGVALVVTADRGRLVIVTLVTVKRLGARPSRSRRQGTRDGTVTHARVTRVGRTVARMTTVAVNGDPVRRRRSQVLTV